MDSITLPGAAGGQERQVDLAAFPDHVRHELMLHGLQQKVADCCSGAKAKGWTEAQALEACENTIASLLAGTWAKRAAGPRARNEDDYVAQKIKAKVLAAIKAKKAPVPTPEALAEHVAKLVTAPANAAVVAALRAEYQAKRATIDLDMDV